MTKKMLSELAVQILALLVTSVVLVVGFTIAIQVVGAIGFKAFAVLFIAALIALALR